MTTQPTRYRGTCNSRRLSSGGYDKRDCLGVVNVWDDETPRYHEKRGYYSQTRCHTCDSVIQGTPIKVRHSDTVVCDAKCYGAKSDGCTCSCDGANHGKAWEGARSILA